MIAALLQLAAFGGTAWLLSLVVDAAYRTNEPPPGDPPGPPAPPVRPAPPPVAVPAGRMLVSSKRP